MNISNLTEPQPNLHSIERTFSLALGALGLGILWRRRPAILGLTAMSVFLLWRGATGRCLLYAPSGFDAGSQSKQEAFRDHDAPPAADVRLPNPVDEASRESFPASDPPATW